METNKLFEAAVRGKYRYPYRGTATTEDLWDLTTPQLDEIYKALKSKEKKAQEESLLNTRSQADQELENKIEIVKYIVSVKLAEAEAARRASDVAAQKQKIMAILADKQDQDLRSKSPEELLAMLEQLG